MVTKTEKPLNKGVGKQAETWKLIRGLLSECWMRL